MKFYQGLEPLAEEFVVNHTRNNAFYNSQLAEIVNQVAPQRLAVAGVSTAYVVESTVRHASDVGYSTAVVSDACSTATRQMHQNALDAMRLVADVTSVDELLASI